MEFRNIAVIENNKYLGINLIKEVRDFYYENYKTLMKEIEAPINGKK